MLPPGGLDDSIGAIGKRSVPGIYRWITGLLAVFAAARQDGRTGDAQSDQQAIHWGASQSHVNGPSILERSSTVRSLSRFEADVKIHNRHPLRMPKNECSAP